MTMTITKNKNIELESCKNQILFIEKNIERANIKLDLAIEMEEKSKVKELNKTIDFGLNKIKEIVSIQSESMKLDYNLVMDLIFDREYTLQNN